MLSVVLTSRIPPSFQTYKKEGGEFFMIVKHPKNFPPAAGFETIFNAFIAFSGFLARRRRKIFTFQTSRTRFPFRKSMSLPSNPQNFRLRRNLSDRSQIIQKRRGEFFIRGGEFLMLIPLMQQCYNHCKPSVDKKSPTVT